MTRLLLSIGLALIFIMLPASPAQAETKPAPSFTLADASGNDIRLPAGKETVEIYLFWASWCPYCKALMPHLQSMLIEYGDEVRVYALHIRDDEDPVAFMDEQAYDFVLLPDADDVMPLYGVRPTPGLFLVDQQGMMRFNLYDIMFNDSDEFKALGNRQKSARRAPYWAAAIRKKIDQIIADSRGD